MRVILPSANMGDTKLNWMKGHFSRHQKSLCNTFIHFIEHCASGSIKMSCNITENHLIQYIWQPKIDWGIDNIKFPASLFCECAQSSLYSSQGRGFVKSSCQLPSLQLLGVERRLFKSVESNPCCFSQTFMSSRWPRVILSLLTVNVNLTSPLHN